MDKYNLLKVNEEVHGYKVLRVEELPKIGNTFYELEHLKTGARHIHLSNDDTNNFFFIAFKTAPEDSTGVPHILEHTVLCGSRKYPVRDPFFSMYRRSVNTFMNALTASDWTGYPFGSQNKTDFYNLMDVYLDACFYPNLDETDFRQEGHRFEFEEMENKASELTLKGIVFNEMKGAMSSPDRVFIQGMESALYPTTTYHYNSGGAPEDIPNLSYDKFVAFHKRFYHPSNSYCYTYGNFPLKEHLRIINNSVFSDFNKIDPKTDIPNEKRFVEEQVSDFSYPLGKGEDDGAKNYAAYAWLTASVFEPLDVLGLELLSNILLGSAAAPLQKALLESGLGASLSDMSGFAAAEAREMFFSAGLQGVKAENIDKVHHLIMSTLRNVVENGISKEEIDSAIHQKEFQVREIKGVWGPYCLDLAFRFLADFIHNGDPLNALDFDKLFADIRVKIDEGRYFENLILKYIVDNPHRIKLIMRPDHHLEERMKIDEKNRIQSAKDKMTEEDLDEIVSSAVKLKEKQESIEDLTILPMIKVSDLDKEVLKLIKEPMMSTIKNTESYDYEMNTNGVFSFKLSFDVKNLSEEELKWLPVFALLLKDSGTDVCDYEAMAKRISLYTGGVSTGVAVIGNMGGDLDSLRFSISSKALSANVNQTIAIVSELLTGWKFDTDRAKTVLNKKISSNRNSILETAMRYIRMLTNKGSSSYCSMTNMLSGLPSIQFLESLVKEGTNLEEVLSILDGIGKKIINSKSCTLETVGNDVDIKLAKDGLSKLIDNLPENNDLQGITVAFSESTSKEAWTMTTPVSYVGKGFKAPQYTDSEAPYFHVLEKLITAKYLHPELREKGGAYGGTCMYSSIEGTFAMLSYRDPNFKKTLNVYDNTLNWLMKTEFSNEDIDEAILQVISDFDSPNDPEETAFTHTWRQQMGLSYDVRQKMRTGLLNCTKESIVSVAEKYLSQETSEVAITSNEIFNKEQMANFSRIEI